MSVANRPLRLFFVAGEHSGDQLGGKLIAALSQLAGGRIVCAGVGGEAMAREGCPSLFPLSEVAVMGPLAIARRLPALIRRVHQTVEAALDFQPDALVILDSPEFTHPIARRVKRKLPHLPVIDYVSPSIWAWRPGRARRMRRYIDHVLAILPFEPAAHERLGGPPCTYVGHPLIERLNWIETLRPEELAARLGLAEGRPIVAALPGSRASEVTRMIRPYGEALALITEKAGPVEVIVPTVDSVASLVHEGCRDWPVVPHFVTEEEEKFTAFRLADAALATSGTVTLELALAGTPMAVAYRVEPIVTLFRWMLKAHSIVLPNLILGQNAFPEFVQKEASPQNLSRTILALLQRDSAERKEQLAALKTLRVRMTLPSGTPSARAAETIISCLGSAGRGKRD